LCAAGRFRAAGLRVARSVKQTVSAGNARTAAGRVVGRGLLDALPIGVVGEREATPQGALCSSSVIRRCFGVRPRAFFEGYRTGGRVKRRLYPGKIDGVSVNRISWEWDKPLLIAPGDHDIEIIANAGACYGSTNVHVHLDAAMHYLEKIEAVRRI
jgi:hypothetical protein